MREPYDAVRTGPECVVTFAEITHHPREEHHDVALGAHLGACQRFLVDLTRTRLFQSDWWRLLGQLAMRARREGVDLRVVGASEALRRTADAVAVGSFIRFDTTLDAARRP